MEKQINQKPILIFILVFIPLALLFQKTEAQNGIQKSNDIRELKIGDKVPARIWKMVPRKKNTRLIILDFWGTLCSSCIAAFPKMEKLQKQFPDSLQIILVNNLEDDLKIKQRFDAINKGLMKNEEQPIHLPDLPAINSNDNFRKLFPATALPHHVWLTESGTVLYITYGHNATAGHVRKVLNGETVTMALKSTVKLGAFEPENASSTKSRKAVSPVFYSAFFLYNSGFSGYFRKDSTAGTLTQAFNNVPILSLYQTAFTSNRKRLITILEVNQKSDFEYPNWLTDGDIMDEWFKKNIFSYEITVPFRDEKKIDEYMQADLNRFFGSERGIEGVVTKRVIPCLILVTQTDGKLPVAVGGKKQFKEKENVIVSYNNYLFADVIANIGNAFENSVKPLAFVNETNIDRNLKVDMQLTGNLKNLENLRDQLRHYGLDIMEVNRELDVLVIRNKQNPQK